MSFLTGTAAGAKVGTLNIASNAAGSPHSVALSGELVANTAATGAPAIDNTLPIEGQTLTASPGTFDDVNGLVGATYTYQWQQSGIGVNNGFQTVATGPTFTVTQDQVNRRIRVVATTVDNLGSTENRNSTATQFVGDIFVGTELADLWQGTPGVDTAAGGDGNDTMNALAGNDVVSGDGGDDTINTGAGNDVIRVNGTGDGFDAVTGDAGTDRIEAMSNGTVIGLRSMATVENVIANGFSGVTIAGSEAPNTLNFSAASFTLAGITAINAGGGGDNINGTRCEQRHQRWCRRRHHQRRGRRRHGHRRPGQRRHQHGRRERLRRGPTR